MLLLSSIKNLAIEVKMSFESKIKTIEWVDNKSRMINQLLLPKKFELVNISTCKDNLITPICNKFPLLSYILFKKMSWDYVRQKIFAR